MIGFIYLTMCITNSMLHPFVWVQFVFYDIVSVLCWHSEGSITSVLIILPAGLRRFTYKAPGEFLLLHWVTILTSLLTVVLYSS